MEGIIDRILPRPLKGEPQPHVIKEVIVEEKLPYYCTYCKKPHKPPTNIWKEHAHYADYNSLPEDVRHKIYDRQQFYNTNYSKTARNIVAIEGMERALKANQKRFVAFHFTTFSQNPDKYVIDFMADSDNMVDLQKKIRNEMRFLKYTRKGKNVPAFAGTAEAVVIYEARPIKIYKDY